MKRFILFTVMLTATAMLSAAHAADTGKADAKTEKPALHNQTHCPVMGGAIDSTAYTDIQGQRVYHCCPMCTAKLKADPDKYFKEAAAQGVLFENIQTTCPVSHETLEKKDIFTDYEGRRIYFCCEKCQAKFGADPQGYLSKMGAKDSENMPESEMNHEHMQHDTHHDQKGH